VPRARLAYVSAAHYGERTVSDDFAWRPATSPRATSPRLRVTVVLACAGVGLVAGSLHPINKLITAFEPASHPHVTAKANLAASAVQDGRREVVVPQAEASAQESLRLRGASSGEAPRVVLLNPGSAERKAVPETPLRNAPSVPRSAALSHNLSRQHRAFNARGDRNVLVVVRRRGPPYDTKILQGRIREGRLIVNAGGLTIR
jgi:hypothetical protein